MLKSGVYAANDPESETNNITNPVWMTSGNDYSQPTFLLATLINPRWIAYFQGMPHGALDCQSETFEWAMRLLQNRQKPYAIPSKVICIICKHVISPHMDLVG